MAGLGASEGSQSNPGAVRFREPPWCAREIVNAAVAAAFTVPLGELRASTRRGASVALARQSAMYLAHVALGLSFSEIGRTFGRDRTTAAYACRRIEDRRVDSGLDRTLAELEHALRRNADATSGALS